MMSAPAILFKAFAHPEECLIIDARACYSRLNALLVRHQWFQRQETNMTSALPPTYDFFEFMKTSKVPVKKSKAIAKNAQAGDKARFFFSVFLELPTDKRVTLDKVYSTMTVKQLKLQIETETGIAAHIQRLRYLDDYDMEDDSRLSFFHVVPGATIRVVLWPEWNDLIKASSAGDFYGVLACGIKGPEKQDDPKAQKEFNDKAAVALYLASHMGHMSTISRLIEAGVDPCKVLPSGKSPIHVAVEQQHVTCVSILIGLSQAGSEPQKPNDDHNAIRKSTFTSVATLLKKKRGWRKIVQQRDQRKKRKEDKTKLPFLPREEFQKCDSSYPTHIQGTLARKYQCTILQTEARYAKKRYEKPWL